MKTRYDFVSNSSSSSFIIDHASNRYRVFLDYKGLKHLTLSQYIDEFGEREISFDYYSSTSRYYPDEKREMQFVTTTAFAKLFPMSIQGVLPITAKKDWEKLISLSTAIDEQYNKLNKLNKSDKFEAYRSLSNDAEMLKLREDEDNVRKTIIEKVKKALQPKYGKTLFDYVEIDDNSYIGYDDNDDEAKAPEDEQYMNEEDRAFKKYELLKDYLPVRFWRVFSNH